MSLVSLAAVLQPAQQQNYAVGAFNFNGIEDARGILDAAEALRSPVILMTSINAVSYMGGPEAVAGYISGLSELYTVPVVLHLDHAEDYDFICHCVDAGYSSVMIDASKLPYEENIFLTRRVAEYAHSHGVSVEAELGCLGGREENISVSDREAALTEPQEVPEFVARTGIDALAVAIGTQHGFYKAEPKLDFERLKRIRSLTSLPLVLHGGTGISDADFNLAIDCGMSKINVGTELKYCCGHTLHHSVAEQPDQVDVRKLVGPVRKAICELVSRKLTVFCSANRA